MAEETRRTAQPRRRGAATLVVLAGAARALAAAPPMDSEGVAARQPRLGVAAAAPSDSDGGVGGCRSLRGVGYSERRGKSRPRDSESRPAA